MPKATTSDTTSNVVPFAAACGEPPSGLVSWATDACRDPWPCLGQAQADNRHGPPAVGSGAAVPAAWGGASMNPPIDFADIVARTKAAPATAAHEEQDAELIGLCARVVAIEAERTGYLRCSGPGSPTCRAKRIPGALLRETGPEDACRRNGNGRRGARTRPEGQ